MEAKVVIIGGGVIGASCLYHLAQKGCTDVILLEKDSYAHGSTGKSAGIVETQYVSEEDILLRARSMPLFKEFKEKEGLPLETNGYMRLSRQQEDREKFERSVQIQASMGAEAKVLSKQEISQIVPELDTDGIECALFGPNDAYLDPYILTSIYIEKAKALGARASQGTSVEDIVVKDGKIHSVITNKGEIKCEMVVNAAGAWAKKVGQMVGLDIPVEGYRRQIVVMKAPDIKYVVPSVMDYVPGKEREGIYFRHERGDKIFAGLHWEAFDESEEACDPDNYPERIDNNYVERLAVRLLQVAPGFDNLQVQNGWAGLYPLSPDYKPIIGETPEIQGFYNCVGFGGNGVQLSPAFGDILSDLIVHGKTDIIDIESFSLNRFSNVPNHS